MKRLTPNTCKIRLKASELERSRSLSGGGESSKYTEDGRASLNLIRALAKARLKAGRFVLYSDQLGVRLYLKDTNGKLEAPFTLAINEALEFYEGFDDPATKAAAWAETIKQFTELPIIFHSKQTRRPKNNGTH